MSEAHPDEFLVHDILDGNVEGLQAFNRILARIAEQQEQVAWRESQLKDATARIAQLETEKVNFITAYTNEHDRRLDLLAALEAIERGSWNVGRTDYARPGDPTGVRSFARAAIAAAHQGEET